MAGKNRAGTKCSYTGAVRKRGDGRNRIVFLFVVLVFCCFLFYFKQVKAFYTVLQWDIHIFFWGGGYWNFWVALHFPRWEKASNARYYENEHYNQRRRKKEKNKNKGEMNESKIRLNSTALMVSSENLFIYTVREKRHRRFHVYSFFSFLFFFFLVVGKTEYPILQFRY